MNFDLARVECGSAWGLRADRRGKLLKLLDAAGLNDGSDLQACASIGRYLGWYNESRPHSNLDRRTPEQAYFNNTPLLAAA